MRRALAVRRLSGVVHARALCNRAREPHQWTALEALDVRLSLLARGDNHHAHLIAFCALPIKQRASPASSGSRISSLIARNSAGFPHHCLASASARRRLFSSLLCSVYALLCLVSAPPLLCSVSRLLPVLCLCLASALVSAVRSPRTTSTNSYTGGVK